MALKVLVIVAVAVVLQLASSDFTPTGLEYDFGDLSDLIKCLKNRTYPYPRNVTEKCFRSNRENFKCLARELADLTTVVKGRFEKWFNNTKITEAMKNYSESFRVLPKTLWCPLERLAYDEGLKAIDNAGMTEFTTQFIVFTQLLTNVTATEKAKAQIQKILDSKKNKTQKLTVKVKRCLEAENSKLHPKEMHTQ